MGKNVQGKNAPGKDLHMTRQACRELTRNKSKLVSFWRSRNILLAQSQESWFSRCQGWADWPIQTMPLGSSRALILLLMWRFSVNPIGQSAVVWVIGRIGSVGWILNSLHYVNPDLQYSLLNCYLNETVHLWICGDDVLMDKEKNKK